MVAGVERAADHVARRKVGKLVGTRADRLQVVRRVARFRTTVGIEQMLRDDHAPNSDKSIRPERLRLRKIDPHRQGVDGRYLDVLVRSDGRRGGRRVGGVFPVEHDIGRGEGLAVVPQHVLFQLPSDRLAVLRQAAVGHGRNLCRKHRNKIALPVPACERLIKNARAILVLGARGEVRVEQRRPLPPQHLERSATAALGALVRGSGLRLSDARMQQQLARNRRGDPQTQQGRDEFPARERSLPYRFDQIPQSPLGHDSPPWASERRV